ncbi:MAG: endonuclease MutS2 [Vicinamibacterales bacterium]
MKTAALRALEFDRIVDTVRGFALTPMGDERLADLSPSSDRAEVAERLAATTETARYIAKYGLFPLRASADLATTLTALDVEGRALEGPRLLLLGRFVDSVDETRAAIRRVAPQFGLVEKASAGAASFRGETAEVRRAIDDAGDVVDDASPTLRSLRDRLRKQRTRLRATLEAYLRGKDTSKYLQEQLVTERNGRYVLVVRAEHRGSIPGLVHGTSTSGMSLYLEPIATVEINNDIVQIEEQEAEEVQRILLALTELFRGRPDDLARTIEAAAALDVLQARARFSQSIDGIEPMLSHDGAFELQAARHPLLKSAVPVTVKIVPPATVLLITGPNTGGKTVALKTAGLFALMAQSGLHIPAANGSRLPVFRSVFADIGDEQSIEASLSTFSAHITNIASMDRELVTPALVLLDEVGSGTDPIEGGALGVAIIDHLRVCGATVVATSHYDALKSYASTTAGVQSAAFGFDPANFAPTYSLIYGSPGRSLALEIAARLGLNPSVVAAARQNISEREAKLADHLAKMDDEMRALRQEHEHAARDRDRLAAEETRLRDREDSLREREETFRRKLTTEINAQVRQARKEIDAVIEGLKAKTQTLSREAAGRLVSTGTTGRVRAEARAEVDAVAHQTLEPVAGATLVSEPQVARVAVVGDRVVLGSFGLEGVVMSLRGQTAEVDVRGKRMRATVSELRVVGSAPVPKEQQVRVNVNLHPREVLNADLNVVGCTVEEALSRAERFLDESLLSDQRTLRFVHGHGTGQLRRALGEFLRQHPLVVSVAAAPNEQGGGGVTVVELRD